MNGKNATALRVCKRCLLSEDDAQTALAKTVAEYIALLPLHEQVEKTEYRRRLSACKACDELRSGLCALCGCYVEARAAKARMHCPGIDKKW